jgi:hypothetical protein
VRKRCPGRSRHSCPGFEPVVNNGQKREVGQMGRIRGALTYIIPLEEIVVELAKARTHEGGHDGRRLQGRAGMAKEG